MTKDSFNIDEIAATERIDVVLVDLIGDVTRSFVQKHIDNGKVTVNGIVVKSKSYRVREGDSVEIQFDDPILPEILPEDIPIEIIHEDQHILVVNKPKGMVVHPAPGNYTGTLVNGILYHCKGRLSSINGVIRPGIVHRLDKDTSGAMVVAKTDYSHRHLAGQFANHSVKRVYRAIVHNNFAVDEGTIDAPIGRDPKNRLRMAVIQKNGREARTHYRVLERFGQFTYIEAMLETGRTHQIRVHMAYIKHPLLGDEIYGPKIKDAQNTGQMLHAALLGFNHPATGEYKEFESPLPYGFEKKLKNLR